MLTNDRISKSALDVLKTLTIEGFQAYLVGGAVRDILLEITPKDHDICTNATPEQLKRLFRPRAKVIGRRFRLVHVYTRKEIIEVSTFRRKPTLKERKGRKSDSGLILWRDNFYGSLKEDAKTKRFYGEFYILQSLTTIEKVLLIMLVEWRRSKLRPGPFDRNATNAYRRGSGKDAACLQAYGTIWFSA